MADRDLLQAFQAACAFIDAHVADPDITPKMVETYAEFVRWRGIVEAGAGDRTALAADERAEGAKPADPLDWPLPCSVTVGHITISKGCKLRALVARMQAMYRTAQGGITGGGNG